METSAGNLAWITPDWPAPARVHAASTLRIGGVSGGGYASLNLGSHVGDHPAAVLENRRRLRSALRLPAEPLWLNQVHGKAVAQPAWHERPPTADVGVFNAYSGGARGVCAILTADCLPVLFCDRAGTRVAAAHAGWRGLAGGVLGAAVNALGVPPDQLLVWLGPAIGPGAFEVGAEVVQAFAARNSATASAFTPNARGRWQADLYLLARLELASLGVEAVHGGGWCTVTEAERFFSYRRDGQTGRMATLIWLE